MGEDEKERAVSEREDSRQWIKVCLEDGRISEAPRTIRQRQVRVFLMSLAERNLDCLKSVRRNSVWKPLRKATGMVWWIVVMMSVMFSAKIKAESQPFRFMRHLKFRSSDWEGRLSVIDPERDSDEEDEETWDISLIEEREGP